MERYKLEVELRSETGKGAARSLRRQGFIPGVIYGRNRKAQSLTVDPGALQKRLNSNAIIDLTIDGEDEHDEETVMIKDYQKDVIKGNLIHVDFQKISMDEKITLSVPVNIVGAAPGVQEGGVLQQLMREVQIEAYPGDIPDEIDLDISELNMGDSLQVSDLQVAEEVNLVDSLDDVIVTVVAPSEEIEDEIEEEVEDEFIEPEVIGEEEEVEEGAETEEEEATEKEPEE